MRVSLLIAFFVAILKAHCTFGQEELPPKAKKILLKAEHLYHHFHYYDAIDYYQRFLTYRKHDHETLIRIADSYYKVRDYDMTLAWYDSAVMAGDLPPQHEFQYADVLMNHGKNEKAKVWLKKYLESQPDDRRAREKLEGLENVNTFFEDSSFYKVSNVPINSKFSDFSPALYQKGFVFVSAREETSKKREMDQHSNGAYLDLYYTAVTDSGMTAPERLTINSKFHEGPLALYDSGRKMIFTRNDYIKKKSTSGGSNTVHFQMFHTEKDAKGIWATPKVLPIHNKQYSMGHPSISRDGKTLYFASNLPGGQGGSDLYKSVWENDTWGPPQNLGATINTEGNEMFPYIMNDTVLYFSSDGFRGLGGLDIFRINLNQPSRVYNMGYPVNSSKDDFGVLLNEYGSEGYFSSNREGGAGNDDIYKVNVRTKQFLVAKIIKEADNTSLAGALVKILSFIMPDLELVANDEGIVNFILPDETAFVIVGSKDNFIGIYSVIAEKTADKSSRVHIVPTNNNHETQLPVVGLITNQRGEILKDAIVTVTEKGTGKKIPIQLKEGLLSFFGEKGKEYTIAVEDENYKQASEDLKIPATGTDVEKISITLEDKELRMAVRVFKESDQTPLGGAHVRVISFVKSDMEVTANEEGVAEFTLPDGTAYVVIGNKDSYTGMHSGMAEAGQDKASVIHPVPANNDPDKQLPILGMVIDETGTPLSNVSVVVTDVTTGQTLPVKIDNGILYFYGKKGGNYKVLVSAENFDTQEKDVLVDPVAAYVQPVEFNMVHTKIAEVYYTVQILALKSSKLVRRSFLQQLKGVKLHDGKDGFHRYTYGHYNGTEEAFAMLKTIQDIGYKDAFIRRVELYAELSTAPGEDIDKLYRQMGRFSK